jgi:orotidine-5'-phosphate decarboxylase
MNSTELAQQIQVQQSYLCVGLDTDIHKLPPQFSKNAQGVIAFNKAIIDATLPYCVSYKLNTAFYEAMGIAGWEALQETIAYIPSTHFTIADAKRGDIGNTSTQYAKTFFETYGFDAVTVAPYMGEDSVKPFLEYTDKVTIVLALTSNNGAIDFQKQALASGQYLYQNVLNTVAQWGTTQNLMFVVGATQAIDLVGIRQIIPEHFLLVPGIGFQGGSLDQVSKYGLNKNGGLLVNASRAIIYAGENEQFAIEAAAIAEQYQQEMQQYLQKRPA